MADNYVRLLAFARLASWLDFPVGVVEESPSHVFVFLVRFPTEVGTLRFAVPKSSMRGRWNKIEMLPDERVISVSQADDLFKTLVMADLRRTLYVHKEFPGDGRTSS